MVLPINCLHMISFLSTHMSSFFDFSYNVCNHVSLTGEVNQAVDREVRQNTSDRMQRKING